MVIGKFIECSVESGKRSSFSRAQQFWRKTQRCEGFRGQIGGWDILSQNAVILALWKDQTSLDSFATSVHDQIFKESQQANTYLSSSIALFSEVMEINSSSEQNSPIPSNIGFIRIEDCHLFPEGVERFEEYQIQVWNPGMSACPGMLGGYFWRSLSDSLHYKVTTFWQSDAHHLSYTENVFPSLKNESRMESVICDLKGYQINVVSDWNVDANTASNL